MAHIEKQDSKVWTFYDIQQRTNEINTQKNGTMTENLFVLLCGKSKQYNAGN